MTDEQWDEIRPYAEIVDRLRTGDLHMRQMSGMSAYMHPCRGRLLAAIRDDARKEQLAKALDDYRTVQARVLGKVYDNGY